MQFLRIPVLDILLLLGVNPQLGILDEAAHAEKTLVNYDEYRKQRICKSVQMENNIGNVTHKNIFTHKNQEKQTIQSGFIH